MPSGCESAGVAEHVVVSATHTGRGDSTVDRWQMGDGCWLMRVRYRSLAASSAWDRPNLPSERLITMAVLDSGEWTLSRRGVPVEQRSDQLTLVAVDQSSAFDFRGHGTGSFVALHVTHARLTLSIETIHRGIDNLHPGQPLYSLARTHLQQLGVIATSSTPLVTELAASSVAVMRSLLIGAADSAERIDATGQLISQIETYIDTYLPTIELGADMIASAHHVSVRHLYKIWPEANGTLGSYITSRRLERARASLIARRDLGIAEIARRHGFAHPTHFTHRFRDAYGLSPSEFRRQNQR